VRLLGVEGCEELALGLKIQRKFTFEPT